MNRIGEALKYLLWKAFDVREGESVRAVLMQMNIFLLISTLLIVKPTVNALFLSKLGVEKLPIVFVLVAISAALVVTLYSRLLSRQSLEKIIIRTLVFSILVLLFFGIMLRLNFLEGGILYLFYIFVSIFAVLSTSQFWILANLVFNAREAKRLFGFIGAGAIAGGIFGGYLTSLLAPFIGSENLLFVCAALLLCCIPIVRHVWKNFVEAAPNYFQRSRTSWFNFSEHPLRLIRHSRHLTFLASITGISVIVAKLVDYQFSAISSAAIEDPDELAAFFGFWLSNLNLASLLVQLFLTSRVVGVLGVGLSLFFLPMGILIGAVLLLFFPELWAAVLLKINDGSLKQSINKASMELLALPIPADIKKQTKTFIDVSVDSAATGLGGLILIFLVSGLDLSTRFISLMILLLIGVWAYFAWQVREEYIKTFKLRIEQAKGENRSRKTLDLESESVLGGLIRVLERGTDRQILFVLDKIRELNDDRFFEPVRQLIHHDNPEIRAEALRNLYFFSKRSVPEEIEPLTTDPDQRVKVRAFEYLINHHPKDAATQMDRFLHHPDEWVRGAALVSLAEETQGNQQLREAFNLEDHLREWHERIPVITDVERQVFYKTALLKATGRARFSPYYAFIRESLHDENALVVRQAIRSAGATLSFEFIDPLLTLVAKNTFREEARKALAGYGRALLEILTEKAEHPKTPLEIVRAIPSVAELIPTQNTVEFLFSLLDREDVVVRLEALRGLNTLKIQFRKLKFDRKDIIRRILDEARLYQDTLAALYSQIRRKPEDAKNDSAETEPESQQARISLIALLERRLDGNLERIFRLLGLKYDPEDIIPIYKGIQNKKPDMRINAIEFLDNLLEPSLKKVLMPIVDTALTDTISEDAVRSLNLKIPTEYQCFAMLMEGKDVRIKLAVLYLIAQLGDKQYLTLVTRYAESPNPKVRDFAQRALETMVT